MASDSSIPAWKIPWTEESGGLQAMGSQRVGVAMTVQLGPSGVQESGHCDQVTVFVYRIPSAFILISGSFTQTDMQTFVHCPLHPRVLPFDSSYSYNSIVQGFVYFQSPYI